MRHADDKGLYTEAVEAYCIQKKVVGMLLFRGRGVCILGLFAFVIKLTKESIVILNYICSEQPLVICTLMGGYYKDCIAAKSK